MVEDFQKGFYTTSSQVKKEGRKQETTSWQSSSQLQPFYQYQQPQKPGIQQEEQKKAQKNKHTETPTSLEKPRKQAKSALHQEVSKFNPSGK